MESDRVSERSFCSLNTVNLHEHTTKEKFAVNKDDTVRLYLKSLRDGFDTYAAPDVAPLHEDPPTAARRKIAEPPLSPPQSPAQQQQQQQQQRQQGDVQEKKKRRRRMSEDKENDRPPPPPPQLDALAHSPAQAKPPRRKPSGGVTRTSTDKASGVRRRGQTPADVIEAPRPVRGDGGRSSGNDDGDGEDDDDDHCQPVGADPLTWFRNRSKPTVEEEFEEFKKRFVWNGSRLAASSRASGGRAPGDGEEGRNGGAGSSSGSGGGISNSSQQLAIADLRVSGGDAEPTDDRRAPESRLRRRKAKDAVASHDRRQQQPSTSAAGASGSAIAPQTAAVKGEAVARLSALSPLPVETPDEDRSELATRTVDATAATSSSRERLSTGSAAAPAASAGSAAANRRGKQQQQPARPSPLATAAAVPPAAKPQLRLPQLTAGPEARAAAIESRSVPLAALPETHTRASASVADEADFAAAATAVGRSMDPSKLAAIKHKAKVKEPPPTPLSPDAEESPNPMRRRDSQQSTNSGDTDGAFPAESVAAKVETIKLLAREKQRQRLKLKHIERKQRDLERAKENPLSDPLQQGWQQPAAAGHQMGGGVGRATTKWQRHGELPPLGVEAAAGRQSVDKRCASEVAVAAARRRASDFGEVESRAGASEVHPGRVYNLSMNFDAYVRALEKMVDATLKTLAQTEL